MIERTKPSPAAKPKHESFEEVVRSSTPYVMRVLWRLGVPGREREDVAQDVFVSAHRSFGRFDHDRPVLPWIHGVAFHVAKRHLRSTRLRQEDLSDDDIADSGLDPERLVAAEQTRRFVGRVLREIDSGRSVVLSMHDIDGIPLEEVARALGVPETTVKKRLLVARREFADRVHRQEARQRRLSASSVPLLLQACREPCVPEDGVAHVWKRVQGALRATGRGRFVLSGPHRVLGAAILLGIGAALGAIRAHSRKPPSPSEQPAPDARKPSSKPPDNPGDPDGGGTQKHNESPSLRPLVAMGSTTEDTNIRRKATVGPDASCPAPAPDASVPPPGDAAP